MKSFRVYGGELILNRFCVCVVCMRERVRNCESEGACFGNFFYIFYIFYLFFLGECEETNEPRQQ